MNEEELTAKADELKTKAEDLERKEGEAQKKEEELNAREAELLRREADATSIAQTLKQEFQKTLDKQKTEFEERLKQRDEVIKQLAAGEDKAPADESSPFAELNKRRQMQKAA